MTTTALETVAHWIGGERLQEASRYGEVTDPATGAVTRRVAFASAADVDRAVAAATAGFEAWSAQSLTKRAAVLFRFRELLAANAAELARVITAEHGKTLEDARGEVQRGLEVVEFACGAAHLLKGEKSESVATGVDSHSLRQPLGVAVGITPFNFPAMVPMWMFPLALACGNAFVLKPSEKDPSASLMLADWLAEAGLPDGAFNVVHGDKEAVDALLTHPGVASVSFVGSTPIARYVYETGTSHGKRVQALGGAKNHAVVMPDADVEIAADAIASAAYGSAGQRCMAISAAVAVGPAGDALAEALERRVDAVRVGPGAEDGSEMGPLVTGAARERVLGAIEAGVGEGADLRRDGRDVSVPGHEDGFWVGPTLFDRVTPEMTIYRDEIFGPVLILLRADTFEQALDLVNRNPYGNGAAIFTGDGRTAREFEARVQVGMVGVNVPIPVPMAYYSFGGWKQSLFGDLHVHGREGVLFYTRGKVVTERWPEQARGADYGFPAHK
jgi:malonate-semialdehyde dehydrogenase (acetylating)/methylmalonate-semialdehyde dehydrogenase